MKPNHAVAVALAAVLAGPGAVLAQQTGNLYVGGSFGETKAKDWCDVSGAPGGVTVPSCDNKGSFWKAFVGYQFHRNFAVEGTYLQTDDFSGSFTFGGATGTVSANAQAFGAAALGLLPVGERFTLFGKLGLLITDSKGSGSIGATTVSVGDDETEVHYGFGGVFSLSRNWGIRAEWETTEKSKLDSISVGVQYRF